LINNSVKSVVWYCLEFVSLKFVQVQFCVVINDAFWSSYEDMNCQAPISKAACLYIHNIFGTRCVNLLSSHTKFVVNCRAFDSSII
jgi:hypothetical protein